MNSKVWDLLVIGLEHELNQLLLMLIWKPSLIGLSSYFEKTKRPRRQLNGPFYQREHFRDDRSNYRFLCLPPCLVVFPWNSPDPFFKIKVCDFSLPEFANPARPYQRQFIEDLVSLNEAGILNGSPDNRQFFTVRGFAHPFVSGCRNHAQTFLTAG